MKRIFILSILTLVSVCGFVTMARVTKKTAGKNLNSLVKAPKPKVDANGYYSLLDCPKSIPGVKVTTTQDKYSSFKVKVFMNEVQVDSFISAASSGDVRFVDANFDGYYDIFVGPATSRNYSHLYLWDTKKQFFYHVQATDDLNGYILLNPAKKQLVSRGSSCYCSMYYTIFSLDDDKEVDHETLVEITDPTAYYGYGVKKRYSIFYGDGSDTKNARKKSDTNKKSKLPLKWRKILNSYNTLIKQ